MSATIRDVAARAGVSVATVSRVVNRSPHRVRPATQRRVQAAVRALGYHANIIAQGLKKRSTRSVALIVSDISNPFFPAIARGIEDVARSRGYAVLLCNTYEDLDRERAYLALLAKRMVDGVIFATVGSHTAHLRALRPRRPARVGRRCASRGPRRSPAGATSPRTAGAGRCSGCWSGGCASPRWRRRMT